MNTRAFNLFLSSSLLIGGSLLLTGCKTDEKDSPTERQNEALRDPFNYGPDADLMQGPETRDEVDPTDISGGGTSNLNKKALKRDWDAVFNP